jgi:hypothetical protein
MLNIHPLENNGIYNVLQSGNIVSDKTDAKIQPYNSLFNQDITTVVDPNSTINDIMNQEVPAANLTDNLIDENMGVLLEEIDTPNL